MQRNKWLSLAAGVVLVVAGAVSGQYALITQGVTLAGTAMVVTPAPATVIVPADAKTIQQVIQEVKEEQK